MSEHSAITIHPGSVKGSVVAPPSKSIAQRICAAALLRGGTTIIQNYGHSNDEQVALTVLRDFGAEVHQSQNTVEIKINNPFTAERINVGESGLASRLFTPIAAMLDHEVQIEGSGSLLQRPMDLFESILPQLGATATATQGKLPLTVKGPLQIRDMTIDGSVSSQFLSGLLLVYGSKATDGVTITVNQLVSKPYIDLTLQTMEALGLNVPDNKDYQWFRFKSTGIKSSATQRRELTVEGDWSGAAFLMVAGAISGEVTVTGLDAFSYQADKRILEALQQSDCQLSIMENQVTVRKSKIKPFHFNATDCPDLFPPLVVLAAYADGTSVIEGIHRLIHKESNRALTLKEEFNKLGVEIELQDNMMVVRGSKPKAAVCHAHNDHRIAMACAIAALGADGPITISNADAVGKSYPEFFNHLRTLGTQL